MNRRNQTPKQKAALKRVANNGKSAAVRQRRPNNNNGNGNGGSRVVESAAAAYFKPTGPRRPQIRSVPGRGGDARIVVKHSEWIANIAGSVEFAVTSSSINPGLKASFPWLSKMAVNYESYRFRSLKYCYKSISSTSAKGSLLLAVDYDAADAAPPNYQTMANYNHSIDTQAWKAEASLACDQADMGKLPQRYIRQGSLASNLDIKTYDVGNFFIATLDMADTTRVGRLWVEYEVELITPQSIFASEAKSSAKIVSGGTVSKTAFMGSVPVITGSLNVTAVTNTITFNDEGEFLVSVSTIGTGLGTDSTDTGTATFSTLYTQYSASTVAFEEVRVKVTASGQTLIMDWSVNTSLSSSIVRITPYEYDLA